MHGAMKPLGRYAGKAVLALVFLPAIFTRWLPQIGNPSPGQGTIVLTPGASLQAALNQIPNGGTLRLTGPGTYTVTASNSFSSTLGLQLLSNQKIICDGPSVKILIGSGTNFTNDIAIGGFGGGSSNTVNGAEISDCTIDGNQAGNINATTNAVILIAGGFPVNGQPGGYNALRRNIFLTSPGQFVMVSDVNVSGTFYPSVGDEIAENNFPIQNGCGQHCIMIYGHAAACGEFFNTRVHDNRIYWPQGFGHEIRCANGVLTTNNQITGGVCCGGQATVTTTNVANSVVTFTVGTTAGLIGSLTGGSGSQLKINRVTYTVQSVTDGTHAVLTTNSGAQAGVAAYGGSLELIHHDTAAFGLTAGNILDTGSDNCMSFINQTGGQTAQGYRIVGNNIRNCGGVGINLDGTTGSGNISLNDISSNTVNGAGQGGSAEALQFDSGIRLATVKDLNNSIQGNWIGDTAASPTMAYAIAFDTVGSGNYPGLNFYGPTVTGQIRGAGNANATYLLSNQTCIISLQNTNTSPGYCLLQGDSGNGITLGDVLARVVTSKGYLAPGVTTFASLGTPANGVEVFCSDCNATCSAGASTGRMCSRENGAWVGF